MWVGLSPIEVMLGPKANRFSWVGPKIWKMFQRSVKNKKSEKILEFSVFLRFGTCLCMWFSPFSSIWLFFWQKHLVDVNSIRCWLYQIYMDFLGVHMSAWERVFKEEDEGLAWNMKRLNHYDHIRMNAKKRKEWSGKIAHCLNGQVYL